MTHRDVRPRSPYTPCNLGSTSEDLPRLYNLDHTVVAQVKRTHIPITIVNPLSVINHIKIIQQHIQPIPVNRAMSHTRFLITIERVKHQEEHCLRTIHPIRKCFAHTELTFFNESDNITHAELIVDTNPSETAHLQLRHVDLSQPAPFFLI